MGVDESVMWGDYYFVEALDRLARADAGPHPAPSRSQIAVRLIAVDVDAALAGSTHALSGASVDAVAAVRRSGVEIVLVSALGARMLRGILRQLRLFEPAQFIAAQGALTGALAHDGVLRVVHESAMPLAAAHELVAIADAVGLTTSWFRGFDWFVPRVDETIAAQADDAERQSGRAPPRHPHPAAGTTHDHRDTGKGASPPGDRRAPAARAHRACVRILLPRHHRIRRQHERRPRPDARERVGIDADEVETVAGQDIAGSLINLLCT